MNAAKTVVIGADFTRWGPRNGPHTPNAQAAAAKPWRPSSVGDDHGDRRAAGGGGAVADGDGGRAGAVVGGGGGPGQRHGAVAARGRAGDRHAVHAERVRLRSGGGALDPHGEPHRAAHGGAAGRGGDDDAEGAAGGRVDREGLGAGGLAVGIAHGDRGRAGAGDVGGRDAGGHPRGADERGCPGGTVPEDRRAGDEVTAIGGEREGGAARGGAVRRQRRETRRGRPTAASGPADLDERIAGVLVIHDGDVVVTGGQRDRRGIGRGLLVAPCLDDRRAVDRDAH